MRSGRVIPQLSIMVIGNILINKDIYYIAPDPKTAIEYIQLAMQNIGPNIIHNILYGSGTFHLHSLTNSYY